MAFGPRLILMPVRRPLRVSRVQLIQCRLGEWPQRSGDLLFNRHFAEVGKKPSAISLPRLLLDDIDILEAYEQPRFVGRGAWTSNSSSVDTARTRTVSEPSSRTCSTVTSSTSKSAWMRRRPVSTSSRIAESSDSKKESVT
ncbi:MAG: hypothetical protein AUG06_00325 [Actinobacteria bacterium 13_1_20CM_2_65_11]|nr:MAG: hypothetical protein AUG06_00325 [Actinobacteria bacterium 13_1_20CM_2_65_11]